MRLEGKTAIITGGGSGFGEGIVRKLVAEGAKVVLVDRDAANAARVAAGDQAAIEPLVADVASAEGFEKARDTAVERFGRPRIPLHNARVGARPPPLGAIARAALHRLAHPHMPSLYFGARAIVPLFKGQKSGAILNVASTGGVSPRPNLTWYNASKGWVITATRGMAVELAPFGIRVNAINPVAGDTPLLKTFMGADTPEVRAKFLSTIPLGRFSTPEDMGNAAAFLCSDEASIITGVAMEVDGGRCI